LPISPAFAAAILLLLLGTQAGLSSQARSEDRRDQVIAEYYAHNPHDADYYRWRKRRNWTIEDYLRWFSTRTLYFQNQPGVAAAFGIDRAGKRTPGFVVN
jgi:hypothetical protein